MLPAGVISLFAARFCAVAVHGPPADGDLAWQRWLGEQILHTGALPTHLGAETFTAAGSPWLPQEWLFGIAVAVAQRTALTGWFDLIIALCAVAALAIVARRALGGGASSLGTALCVLCAGIAMIESFGVRAQVGGWPLLAAFVALLERGAPWAAVAALTVVWANVHAGAVLAPVLAAIWSFGLAVRDRGFSRDVARGAVVTAVTLVALALNPFGFALIGYAVALLRSPIKDFIREWQPASLADASFVWGALPLLAGVAVWACFEGRRTPQRLGLTAVAFVLLLTAARNIPVFALIAAPYAALGFTRALRQAGIAAAAPRAPFALAAGVCLVVLAAATGWRCWTVVPAPHSAGILIGRLASEPGAHRLLCQDFAWCGAAVGRRGIAVFLDGRADPYPLPVWQAAFRVAHREAGWQGALRAYGVDAVIADDGTRLGGALRASAAWRVAATSLPYVLYVRASTHPLPPQCAAVTGASDTALMNRRSRRATIVSAVLGLALIATLTASGTAGPPPPMVSASQAGDPAVAMRLVNPRYPKSIVIEQQALAADINAARAARGLPALAADDTLDRFAYAKASEMASRGYFGHTDPDGITFQDRLAAWHWPTAYAAENIAFDRDEQHANAAFFKSVPHAANLLDPHERRIGIAVVTVNAYQTFYVEDFSN